MLGLHFFSPVAVMNLVEVVVALGSSEQTLERARDFAERIGKRAIVTEDRSGFIVKMLLVPRPPLVESAVPVVQERYAQPASL